MKCPYCGKIIKSKKDHECFIRREAERDIKPLKWRPDIKK